MTADEQFAAHIRGVVDRLVEDGPLDPETRDRLAVLLQPPPTTIIAEPRRKAS